MQNLISVKSVSFFVTPGVPWKQTRKHKSNFWETCTDFLCHLWLLLSIRRFLPEPFRHHGEHTWPQLLLEHCQVTAARESPLRARHTCCPSHSERGEVWEETKVWGNVKEINHLQHNCVQEINNNAASEEEAWWPCVLKPVHFHNDTFPMVSLWWLCETNDGEAAAALCITTSQHATWCWCPSNGRCILFTSQCLGVNNPICIPHCTRVTMWYVPSRD